MVLSQSRFEGPRSDLAAERTFDHKEPQQIRSTAMPTVYSQTTESMYLLSISWRASPILILRIHSKSI